MIHPDLQKVEEIALAGLEFPLGKYKGIDTVNKLRAFRERYSREATPGYPLDIGIAFDIPTILALTDAEIVVGMDPFVENVYYSKEWRQRVQSANPEDHLSLFSKGIPLSYEEFIERYLDGKVLNSHDSEIPASIDMLNPHPQLREEDCPSQRNHVYRREIDYTFADREKKLILYTAMFPAFVPPETDHPSMTFQKGMSYSEFRDIHRKALEILPVGGFYSIGDLGGIEFDDKSPESLGLKHLPEGYIFQKVGK